ncbi:restriction endonuclease subunit S [uncultured Shewanella sp.]|uniref:restriction endonuclease subunit S n=1 Tax=uncultured Shewanella sp. TaxID=173975 RepID=UPI002616B365|nr:restriction endonuclease subunit S [uncultured Shewanella sp.]
MGSDTWELVKLSDLGEVARGRSRHRPRYAEHLYGGNYPFIQTGDVKASQGRITSHEQTYSEAGLAQSRIWPANTMCITIAANIAETGILQYPACFPDSVIGFVADESKADVYFIEYVFRKLRKDLQRQATGSVQDNINLQTLERLMFKIPSLQEQKVISSFLNKLEDKITLNNQINQTLEQMAQALFKSWFVDFDPVRHNMRNKEPDNINGEQANGLDAPLLAKEVDLASLFPDKLVESELGLIPEGWEVNQLSDICKNHSQSYNLKSVDEVVFVNTGDVQEGDFLHKNYSPVVGLPGQAKKAIKEDDILYSEIRPKNKRFAYVDFDVSDYVVSTKFMVIQANEKVHPRLLYMILTRQNTIDEFNIIADSRSGTFPQITFKAISNLEFCMAPREIQDAFVSQIMPMIKLQSSLKSENKQLAELRDTLLPKLLSGEIDLESVQVAQAQAMVG